MIKSNLVICQKQYFMFYLPDSKTTFKNSGELTENNEKVDKVMKTLEFLLYYKWWQIRWFLRVPKDYIM